MLDLGYSVLDVLVWLASFSFESEFDASKDSEQDAVYISQLPIGKQVAYFYHLLVVLLELSPLAHTVCLALGWACSFIPLCHLHPP